MEDLRFCREEEIEQLSRSMTFFEASRLTRAIEALQAEPEPEDVQPELVLQLARTSHEQLEHTPKKKRSSPKVSAKGPKGPLRVPKRKSKERTFVNPMSKDVPEPEPEPEMGDD